MFGKKAGALRRRGLASSAALLALLVPSVGYAQASDGVTIEEVVITARKRAETVQDAPVSVTAFTAETMERQGVTDIVDVSRRTPGLQVGEFGDLKLSPTSLRGVYGSSGSAGADPAVGYYVDEVFIGQGAGASLDLYDIERVEVLRGPQGTLFGRNTIGGVISVTTKRPTNEFSASVTADVSNYDGRRIGASISGPLFGDVVKGKIAAIFNEREGASENIWLNRDVNDERAFTARGQLEFDLRSAGQLLLTADYRKVDQEPLMFETLSYNDAATTPQLLGLFGYPRNLDPFDRKVLGDIITEETLEAKGLAATYTGEFGGVKVTNIASYRRHEYYSRTDTDRTPIRIAYDGDPEKVWRASEELRFDFTTGQVDWLTGVYLYKQSSKNLSFIEIGADAAELLGVPEFAGVLTGSDAELETTSAAAFASATWRISSTWDLTVGGRYTRDRKKIHYVQTDPLGLLGGSTDAPIIASGSWNEFTPNLNIRYRPHDGLMVYATANKGFKSGGFNDALGEANGIDFGPETLWNYELGAKMELFERRLSLNIAAYYMDWDAIQITQDDPTTAIYDPIVLNGGAAHSQGVEVEVNAKPTHSLSLGGNVSIQDARYDGGVLPNGQPLNRIPFAPDYTASAFAEQTFEIGDFDLSLMAEIVARGETYLTPNSDPDGRVKPYELVNLRASFKPTDGPWRLTAWIKNLGDVTYKTRLFDSYANDLVGQKFIILGEPRTYGVELKVEF